jgi:hypothetical protein
MVCGRGVAERQADEFSPIVPINALWPEGFPFPLPAGGAKKKGPVETGPLNRFAWLFGA